MAAATIRSTGYTSNVAAVSKRFEDRCVSVVYNSARAGARKVQQLARPPGVATARALKPEKAPGGVIRCRVVVPSSQFTAVMFDKGTLGKRKLPLDEGAGRRRASWPVERKARKRARVGVLPTGSTRSTRYTAHRSAKALASGGIPAQYFFIRGKRHAEQEIARAMRRSGV